jgi:hypothetical protein
MMPESVPVQVLLGQEVFCAAIRDMTADERLEMPAAEKLLTLAASPSHLSFQSVSVGGRSRTILWWQADPVSHGFWTAWLGGDAA